MSLDINAAMFGTLRRMHSVQRYSSLPVVRPENVAEHSWQVAMLSWLIGLDLRRRGFTIAMEDVLSKAISHDLSETLSGDIIRSFKHSSPEVKSAIDRADVLNMRRLCDELVENAATHFGDEIYDTWLNSKTLLEGKIVAFADMLCVVSYCQEEHALGSQRLDRVLRHLYRNVLCTYHSNSYFGLYVDALFPNGNWNDVYTPAHLLIGTTQQDYPKEGT